MLWESITNTVTRYMTKNDQKKTSKCVNDIEKIKTI